jgi:hypothetical protein
MGKYEDRERFIPFAKAEIVEMLAAHPALDDDDRKKLRAMAKVLDAVFHFKFHEKVEALKAHYAPFDPDKDVRTLREPPEAEKKEHAHALNERFRELLNDANYEELTKEQLDFALRHESLFNVSLFVDYDDFEEQAVFTRGSTVKKATIKKRIFWKKEIDVPTFERVAMLVRFKPKEYFDARKRKKLEFAPGSMLLKLFKDVPKADLEMLFPNTQIRMTTKDKLVLGVPGVLGGIGVLLKAGASIAAAAVVLWVLVESEVKGSAPEYPAAHKMALIVAALTSLIAIIGFVFKQWTAYKNKRLAFMKALTDNLYFRSLDNNAGVFYRVTDAAEEEEFKEAILGYFFALIEKKAVAEDAIDDAIEGWLEREHSVKMDFEIEDSIRKLTELGLCEVESGADEKPLYKAVPLDEACKKLDELWDNYFQYNV